MTKAEQLVDAWKNKTGSFYTDRAAKKIDPSFKISTGFGSKTFIFCDGSRATVAGRGQTYRMWVVTNGAAEVF